MPANMTAPMHRVAAVIPAYRPSAALAELASRLSQALTGPVVIVDDGSGPAFAPIFDQCSALPGVTVLTHAINLGKGAALKTGFNHVLCTWPDCAGVVTADADGQHAVEDIVRVAAQLEKNPGALILGVRKFQRDVPLRSRVGNILSRYIVRVLIGHDLADTQTGLRAIPNALLPQLLRIRSDGYEFELDMLIACKHKGYLVVQTPIETIYIDGNKCSHFNPLRDSLKIYFVLFRFGALSLLTALLDNALFAIAYLASGGLAYSQFLARLGALIFNYTAARRAVFLSREQHKRVLPKYLLNVALSGVCSYLLIRLLMDKIGLGVFWSKAAAETVLFLVNFLVQRDFVFTSNKNAAQPAATDWDSYYKGVPFTAKLTRRYTTATLVSAVRQYANPAPGEGVIVELGGANSCFLQRLQSEFSPSAYHVVDTNAYGLDLLRQQQTPDLNLVIHQQDVLRLALPLHADVAMSVGLVEHFDEAGTAAAIRAHFSLLREGGIAVITFPTPTLLYRLTRGAAEILKIWKFHDERPLLRDEILRATVGTGALLHEKTLWPLVLTQHLMIFRKTPARDAETSQGHMDLAASLGD